MKLSGLTISAAVLAAFGGGSVLAQTSAPVTMQPVPNPPEKAAPMHGHKHHKHHAMKAKADKAADAKAETPAAPSK